MAKTQSTTKAREPALNRLRQDAPEGPPFIGLMLDEATVRCLALGVVNARAEVAAQRAIVNIEALKTNER